MRASGAFPNLCFKFCSCPGHEAPILNVWKVAALRKQHNYETHGKLEPRLLRLMTLRNDAQTGAHARSRYGYAALVLLTIAAGLTVHARLIPMAPLFRKYLGD